MADVDWGAVDSQLKQKAGQWYDPSMLGDVQRNSSYGAGDNTDMSSINDWVNRVSNKAQLRGSNQAGSSYQADGQGGVTVGPTGQVNNPNGDGSSTLGKPQSNNSTAAWTWGGAVTGGNMAGGNGGGGINRDATPQAPNSQPASDQLYQLLMSRATQDETVDPNSPAIRGQADAFSANAQRQRRSYLDTLAEKGGPYTNMTGQERMTAQQTGQASGAFESSLIGQELTAKRDEIQQAINGAQGMLSAEQQMSLQQQLGQMNAEIQRQSNANNYDLGLRNSGLGFSQLDWTMNPNNPANWAQA